MKSYGSSAMTLLASSGRGTEREAGGVQYEISTRNYEILTNTTDAQGRKLEVIKVPCPPPLFRTYNEANGMPVSPLPLLPTWLNVLQPPLHAAVVVDLLQLYPRREVVKRSRSVQIGVPTVM